MTIFDFIVRREFGVMGVKLSLTSTDSGLELITASTSVISVLKLSSFKLCPCVSNNDARMERAVRI